MLHHILAIIGASGSGKTTLSLQAQAVGIPSIVSYTTRPMREGEQDGVDHYFVSVKDAEQMLIDRRELAKTFYGGTLYYALFSQLRDFPFCTYVIDEHGLRSMIDNIAELRMYGISKDEHYKIYPLILERPDTTGIAADRIARDIGRLVNVNNDVASFFNGETASVIRVINDSPSAERFRSWSIAFAVAFFASLKTGHPLLSCVLHTSDDSVSSIQQKLTGLEL